MSYFDLAELLWPLLTVVMVGAAVVSMVFGKKPTLTPPPQRPPPG